MNIVKAEVVVVHVNILIPSERHQHCLGTVWLRDFIDVVKHDCGQQSSIRNSET
jgi:hypothetical protein